MRAESYFKWGKCKIRYHIDECIYWFSCDDIAIFLNLDIEFNWVTCDEVISILHNKYYDKPFVNSFLLWFENEVKPFVIKEEKRLKEEKDLRGQEVSLRIKTDNQVENNQSPLIKSFENSNIEMIIKDDNPYFKLTDIEKVLDLSQGQSAKWIKDGWFDDDEIEFRNSQLGGHPIKYVAESGLYRILNRTNSPKAKPFERWVTKEVLPSIRKTGSYNVQNQFKLPQTYAEALRELADTHEALELAKAQIESDKPKVEFADNVSKAENEVSIGEFAKIFNLKGFGEKSLFKWLRDNGYLRLNNMPYQEYINKRYFRVVEKTREDKNGRIYTYTQTLITGQGQIYFTNQLRQSLTDRIFSLV